MNKYLLLILIVFLFACTSSETDETLLPTTNVVSPQYRTDLKNDSLYVSVFGAAHAHALILPADYSSRVSFPIIIFLDPHAAGPLPLKKYKTLCNSHGYIMVGSNLIKNGMNSEDAKNNVLALIQVCKNYLNIDPSRVYVAGFSGGARVAGTLWDQPGVSGIIYCSAGFEVKQGISKYKIFAGVAGKQDMNYLEVLSTHNYINNEGIKNRFVEYIGKHEWPPLEQMKEVVDFLAVHEEIKTKRKEEGRTKDFISGVDADIKNYRAQKDTFNLFLSLDRKFQFLYGEPNGQPYKDTLARFETTPYIRNWSQKHSAVLNAEIAYQKEIRTWLDTKTPEFWKAKVAELVQLSKKKGDEFNSNSAHRLLGFMSLALYSATSSMIAKQDVDGAKKFAELYRIVDPENSEQCYFNAWVKAKNGECDKVFSLLEEAAKFGFSDSNRLKNEPVLRPCLGDPKRLNALFSLMARSL